MVAQGSAYTSVVDVGTDSGSMRAEHVRSKLLQSLAQSDKCEIVLDVKNAAQFDVWMVQLTIAVMEQQRAAGLTCRLENQCPQFSELMESTGVKFPA